jgi:hypothetical protein
VLALQAYALFYLALVSLDIGAHWAQMYASLLSRAASHKDVGDAKWALLRLYYTKRIFMGMLCVGAEVFYMARPQLHCICALRRSAAARLGIFLRILADLRGCSSLRDRVCCCCRTRSTGRGRPRALRCRRRWWPRRRRSWLRCCRAAP